MRNPLVISIGHSVYWDDQFDIVIQYCSKEEAEALVKAIQELDMVKKVGTEINRPPTETPKK